jgi:signal transduction histidine kinase
MTQITQGAGRKSMLHKLMIGALGAVAVLFSTTAFAQGTADEAKAMLEKAVVALKADKGKTLDIINKGDGGFLDEDLYVFCFNLSDGKTVAAGSDNARKLLGQDLRTFKDANGKLYGPELYAGGQKAGQFTEVSYMFPKPGPDTTPVAKVSFVTNVGDLGCGVGYYK